jgi:hypothetical protein
MSIDIKLNITVVVTGPDDVETLDKVLQKIDEYGHDSIELKSSTATVNFKPEAIANIVPESPAGPGLMTHVVPGAVDVEKDVNLVDPPPPDKKARKKKDDPKPSEQVAAAALEPPKLKVEAVRKFANDLADQGTKERTEVKRIINKYSPEGLKFVAEADMPALYAELVEYNDKKG